MNVVGIDSAGRNDNLVGLAHRLFLSFGRFSLARVKFSQLVIILFFTLVKCSKLVFILIVAVLKIDEPLGHFHAVEYGIVLHIGL